MAEQGIELLFMHVYVVLKSWENATTNTGTELGGESPDVTHLHREKCQPVNSEVAGGKEAVFSLQKILDRIIF